MIIVFKYVSFFLLISLILFSCSRKSTQPEPQPKKPATLTGKLHCEGHPAADVEVLVLEYKPDYDTLGADTTEADSGFFYIDDLPADTVNVIFNDILFTGPHDDYFTGKTRTTLEKGIDSLTYWQTFVHDTAYLDDRGRPNYALDHVMVWFDTSLVDSATAEEIIRSHGTYITKWGIFAKDIASVFVPANNSVLELIKELNFEFYIKGAFTDDYAYLDKSPKGKDYSLPIIRERITK